MLAKTKPLEIPLDIDPSPGREIVFANKFSVERTGRSVVAHFSFWSSRGCGCRPVSIALSVADINRGRAEFEKYYETVFATGRSDEGSFQLLFDQLGGPVTFASVMQVTRMDDAAEIRFVGFSLHTIVSEGAKKAPEKVSAEAFLVVRCEVEMQMSFISSLLEITR